MLPDKGPEMLQFTQAGVIGLIGRNSVGVNVFMNILLTSERIRTGLPAYLLLRLALEQTSLEDALTVLEEKERASPFNYLISEDGQGACNVEGTPTRFVKDMVTKKFYVHTNHCLDQALKKVDVYVQVARSDETLRRYSRMNRLLKGQRQNKTSISGAFRLLCDHENFPDSICRHGRNELEERARFATLGAVMSREGEDGLWVTHGNPCEEKPNFYPLS
jgi:isopenicillin-N N-acyltransferase-like protein